MNNIRASKARLNAFRLICLERTLVPFRHDHIPNKDILKRQEHGFLTRWKEATLVRACEPYALNTLDRNISLHYSNLPFLSSLDTF